MSLSPNEKYPGRVAVDPSYQDGKFKDSSPSTANNGSPLKALDRNEQLALQEAMMNAAGFEYNGTVDTPENSQMFKAYKASLGNGANLLSNHNFLIQTPDDSQPLPSATPTSYPPGYQIFSGVFANETTGITNLTYIDGLVSFSGGDLYFAVQNTGAIERLTAAQLTASVADFDGKPRTRGVSFALIGDEYRITVGVDALEDVSANPTPLGSVKFEQGGVATGHETESLSSRNLSDYTDIVYKASGGNSAFDVMLNDFSSNPLVHAVGSILKTGGTTWEYIDSTGPITRANFRAFNVRNIRDLVNVDESYDYTSKMQSVLDSYSGTRIPLFFSGEFDITETLLLNQQWIISDGAQINKNFDGVGLRITGGSFFFRLRGDLSVVGSGVGFADGSAPSTSPDSHGVSIEGNRLDIDGKFESTSHQGHGFYINCNSNMNRSIIQELHASSNAGLGIRFTGTQDDCSVWQISTYTTLNYQGGVFIDDDFQGRQWSWFCYNEGSQSPTATGVYLGRFRASEDVQIYSEEQGSSGPEIDIGANCENLKVVSLRSGRDNNDSVETCTLISPNGGLWSPEGVAYDVPVRNTALTNNASNNITKQYYGSSNFLIMQDVIDGSGVYTKEISARSGPVGVDSGISPTIGVFNRYYGANYPQGASFKYKGSRVSPADVSPGTIYRNRNYAQIGGTLREVSRQNFNLDSISTTVGTSSYTISLMNNSAALLDILKVHSNGDVESLRPGVGFVASSPDGTKYRLSPPNGGGTATWVAA